MKLKQYNKNLGLILLIVATVALCSCHNLVLMNPKGSIGIEQRTLIITAIALMLLVVIPVILMALTFFWKYRATNKNSKYSPNWARSDKIEAVVWIIPIIIITILGAITWKSTHELDPFKPISSSKKPMTIEVVSLDWKWLFIYPEIGIATVNELTFPKDTPVEFKVTSNSVMNSFFIPQLGGQIYAMAGMQTKLHLISSKPGKYAGISSSYSGRGFSGMKFTAIVTPSESDFNQWVAQVKASPNHLNTSDDFNTLAAPSEHNSSTYFSSIKPNLFKEIIFKFMSDVDMHKNSYTYLNTEIKQNICVSKNAKTRVEE